MKTQYLRRSFQVITLLLVINAGLGYALGWMTFGIEQFCPFGGIETLWAVATNQSFTCAMGPFNLSIMLALLVLTLVVRKAFCSWVCPVGTVLEWLAILGRRLRHWKAGSRAGRALGFFSPSSERDGPWRWLRLPVLALILAFTIGTGELIFRPYDPYYVLFSAHGHEVKFWSYLVVGLILFVGVFLPMAWCRYLCPLGGTLWPFSRIAWLRLKRSNTACTDCGKCDAACPHGIPVSKVEIVDSGECTLCMECTEVCPSREALVVNAPGLPKTPVPAWTVAILVIIASTLGYLSAGAFTYSSYEHKYTDSTMPVGQIETMSFFVDGVMCVDTAITAAKQLENNSGAVSLSAYASSNRLDITFDSSQTNADALVDLIEAPVWNLEASEFQFGIFKVREVKSKSQ